MLESVDFQTGINLLKVNASELAVATVMSAMQACGLSGYRNDSEFSLGRHLRDILSSPIMISNDRILANIGDGDLARRRSDHRCAIDRGSSNDEQAIDGKEARSMNVAFREPNEPTDRRSTRSPRRCCCRSGIDGVYARTAMLRGRGRRAQRADFAPSRAADRGAALPAGDEPAAAGEIRLPQKLPALSRLRVLPRRHRNRDPRGRRALRGRRRLDAGAVAGRSRAQSRRLLSGLSAGASRGAVPARAACCSTSPATASGASRRRTSTGCNRSACANMSASARRSRSTISASAG